ncbi:MAG: molybdopterin-dependent oxidoreductase [Candidatus Delongbacteria bacterium]|nr:molybdopterin-dependent oxidoreductase [Candidatus Delongbacteria bacterium]
MNFFKNTILLISIVLVMFAGCSKVKETQKNVNESFLIAAGEKEITVKVSELSNSFDPLNTDVISINSSGEENKMNVTGVPLREVLRSNGIDLTSFNSVRPVSGDGYSIEIPEDILKKREVLLAYKIDGEPINEKSKPVRIIVPDERAMYWARNVVKIELLNKKESVETGKIVFLETAYKNLEQTKYMYQDSFDPAVKLSELLSKYGSTSGNELYFVSRDGLKRTETKENALVSLIKISGNASPLFLSPDLPGGMFIKEIALFKHDNICFFSLESFQNTTESTDGSLNINEIMKKTEIGESEIYQISSLDGIKTKVSAKDLEGSKITLKDGIYSLIFSDGSKTVNNILSIEKAE